MDRVHTILTRLARRSGQWWIADIADWLYWRLVILPFIRKRTRV